MNRDLHRSGKRCQEPFFTHTSPYTDGSHEKRFLTPFSTPFSRRDLLRTACGAALACSPCLSALAADPEKLFKVGACDWSIGKRGHPDAMAMARKIGLDGVEVSFGSPEVEHDLRRAEVRATYQELAARHKVEIASLAMGVLNSEPYAIVPETQRWVADCVEVMPMLGVKVVLLAFFSKGDIKGKPDLQREVVRRLKRVAPKAEEAGVVLGIESWLNAKEHLRIVNAVNSPAVKVYYDVANMHKMGYDIYQEIRQLGRENICQFHCKENGFLLGKGPIDFVKVREAIDEIGYRGWLIIESARPQGLSIEESYRKNQSFLRSVFPTG
ncbi:MAG: sugar phosphate isomerase/epimerase family protein [Pirellulaceae bacterium]